MKILPIIQNTNRSIKEASVRFKNAYHTGYNDANTYSREHNYGSIRRAYGISKGVTKEIAKATTIDDLPYIAGAIGFLTPIPLASPVMLGLGKIAQIVIKRLHKP